MMASIVCVLTGSPVEMRTTARVAALHSLRGYAGMHVLVSHESSDEIVNHALRPAREMGIRVDVEKYKEFGELEMLTQITQHAPEMVVINVSANDLSDSIDPVTMIEAVQVPVLAVPRSAGVESLDLTSETEVKRAPKPPQLDHRRGGIL